MIFNLSKLIRSMRNEALNDNALRECLDHHDLVVQLVEKDESISLSSVPRWQDWSLKHSTRMYGNRAGVLHGQKYDRRYKRHMPVHRNHPALMSFVKTTKHPHWRCDIQDVFGLGASKAPLHEISCMRHFAERYCQPGIKERTREQLERNLSHNEVRILHEHGGDNFVRHAWNGNRLFLQNSGGSHHFASAQWVAREIGQPVPLQGELIEYSIDPLAVQSLAADFHMYVVRALDGRGRSEAALALREALQEMQATYYSYSLPSPYPDDLEVLLLPRDEVQACRAAERLGQAGCYDFGLHLDRLLERQHELLAEAEVVLGGPEF